MLRAICAERIGVAGRAAIPGPKRALELRKAGRWQEVLDASEQVEAPMRARLDAWLRGWRFALYARRCACSSGSEAAAALGAIPTAARDNVN